MKGDWLLLQVPVAVKKQRAVWVLQSRGLKGSGQSKAAIFEWNKKRCHHSPSLRLRTPACFGFFLFLGVKKINKYTKGRKWVRDQEGLDMVELSGIGLIGRERGRFLNWGCSLIFDCGICITYITVSLYVGHSYLSIL